MPEKEYIQFILLMIVSEKKSLAFMAYCWFDARHFHAKVLSYLHQIFIII